MAEAEATKAQAWAQDVAYMEAHPIHPRWLVHPNDHDLDDRTMDQNGCAGALGVYVGNYLMNRYETAMYLKGYALTYCRPTYWGGEVDFDIFVEREDNAEKDCIDIAVDSEGQQVSLGVIGFESELDYLQSELAPDDVTDEQEDEADDDIPYLVLLSTKRTRDAAAQSWPGGSTTHIWWTLGGSTEARLERVAALFEAEFANYPSIAQEVAETPPMTPKFSHES